MTLSTFPGSNDPEKYLRHSPLLESEAAPQGLAEFHVLEKKLYANS